MEPPHSSAYDLLDHLVEEFAERYRRGQRPSLQEYIDKYPHLADDLREVLPAMVEIGQVEADQRKATVPGPAAAALPLQQVGDYRIIREIGRGGMGVVYEAEQQSLGRRVALKVLSVQVIGDSKALGRFRREARSAAKLHHTNIVPVFDVGQAGEVFYYAMQLIQGQSLDQVVDELRRLRAGSASRGCQPPEHPSSQVSQVAYSLLTGRFEPQQLAVSPPPSQAAAAARPGDLTTDDMAGAPRDDAPSVAGTAPTSSAVLPGQVEFARAEADHRHYFRSVARVGQQTATALVYAHARGIVHRDIKPSNLLLDGSGVVWVTDFGLAKTEDEGLTNTGELPGTLRYMSPERFQGQCDVRTDVYALGLTLYEMLVLKPAFEASDRYRLIEQILQQEPARPRSIDGQIPRDLETIVLKAIDKEPRRRYQTADELAEDLRRYLVDEPIRARRVSLSGRAWRWCRRNSAVAGLVAAVALSLLMGTCVAVFFAIRANDNAAQAYTKEGEALRQKAEAETARTLADLARADADTARGKMQENLYYAEMNLAGQTVEEAGGMARVNELLAHWLPSVTESDRRGWEWYYLHGRAHRALLTLHRNTDEVTAVSWSSDGTRLASGGKDNAIRVWDAVTGRGIATLRGHGGMVLGVAWSPDGRRLASASADWTIKIWDIDTRQTIRTLFPDGGWVFGAAWSPDGRHVAGALGEHMVCVWDVVTGRAIATLRGHNHWVWSVCWSPDGRHLASASHDHTLKVWDTLTWREIATLRGHDDGVFGVTWSPDSQRLASASSDETVKIWDVKTGRETATLRGHTNPVIGVSWSPDGQWLASGSYDYTVRLWKASTGKLSTTLRDHTGLVRGVCWSPDGQQLASAGGDQTIRIWYVERKTEFEVLLGHTKSVNGVSWSPNSRRLASASADKTIRLWDVFTRLETVALRGHDDGVQSACWSPDGRQLASASLDRTVKLWDVDTGKATATLRGHTSGVLAVSWSPDGRRLASGGADRTVKIWDAVTGKDIATLRGHESEVYGVNWSPDGRQLATAGSDKVVKLWNADKGTELATLQGHAAYVRVVGWAPDGRLVASGGDDHLIKIWNVSTGLETATLRGHTSDVITVSWSPDGRLLASGSVDRTVKLWEVRTGREITTLRGHTDRLFSVSWSPNGRLLASSGKDQTVRLWDATPGYVVDGSPSLLAGLDERLQAGLQSSRDLRLRAKIEARLGRWDQAAADWRESARLQGGSAPKWFQAGWWVAGPVPEAARDAAEIEADPDPLKPLSGTDQAAGNPAALHWRWATVSANGCLDLGALFRQTEVRSAYVLVRIYSPGEQPVAALIGASGALRFWHGGEVLYQVDRGRPQEDDEGVPVTLRAGWNTLLFKVGMGTASDRLCLWLSAEPTDRVRALADFGRWNEAEALVTDLVKREPYQPQALLIAARFFRQRSETLRQRGEKAGADRDEQQARSCYEKLLALRKDPAGYAGEFADFLLLRSDRWTVLEPAEVAAAGGSTLTPQSDGSILASGKNPLPETYAITARTGLTPIAAVRLELLPDPALPEGGPGRAPNGNLVLNEFRVTAAPVASPDKARPVEMVNAWADHSQGNFPVAGAIDDDPATGWGLDGGIGQAHVALFELQEPLSTAGGTILTFALEHRHNHPGWVHNIGRFRLSITAEPQAIQDEKLRARALGQYSSPWTKLGMAHYLRGEWQTALAALRQAGTPASAASGWDQLLLTLVHEQLGQHYEPATAEGWIGRAGAYVDLDQPEKATADLAKAIKLQPKDLSIRRTHMDLCLRLKKWDQALADCIKAVELKPDDPELLKLRADLYACCGKWAAAANDFAKLTKMDPSIYRWPWLPWYHHALTLLAAGKTEEYRKACARMLEHFKDTEDLQTLFFTAWTCALGPDALPDFAAALRLAEKALAQGGQDARFLQAVGAIDYRAGRWEECRKHIHAAAAAANPQELTSAAYWYYFLAMAHHRLGHKEEARQWLAKAVAQTDKELRDGVQPSGPERWVRKPTLQILRAEAEALLRGTAKEPAK
jgi:WD40 repeat protein/serine/threonine protein kinase/tetratricopeptide (TPR) repeat protein